MTQVQIMVQTLSEVEDELSRAILKHGMPVDYHHGWGILAEEVEELFREICRKDREQNPLRIAAEAVQVAAVAAKIAMVAMQRAEEKR